jgi:N-acetylmuramoyl-L-alanine amidase
MRWISAVLIVACLSWCVTSLDAQTAPPTSQAPSPSSAQAEAPLLILIDPAHGGKDSGVLVTPTSPEKEITLNMARRLRQELETRGFRCQLVRNGDIDLSADQRANVVNAINPTIYIALHASSLGKGIRVFSSMLPSTSDNKGPFIDWGNVQAATLNNSRTIQAQLTGTIRQTRFPVRALIAPLRPLNNLKVPAIALEISPATGKAAQVASSGYQAMICSTVANALASLMPVLRSSQGMHP